MPTSFERISESWQLETLRIALNFLALDDTAKAAYLPDVVPEMTFLRVRDGGWVRLPNVGLSSRAVSAIIRAWLNRAERAPE
jgi:hypothetical protein